MPIFDAATNSVDAAVNPQAVSQTDLEGSAAETPRDAEDTLYYAIILDEQLQQRKHRPWWRRPSYWWQICIIPVTLLAIGATVPAKMELINAVVCQSQRAVRDGSLDTIPVGPCHSDPKVQAGATAIIAAMTTLTGILACITTPRWGSLSDRYGRVFVLRVYGFGGVWGVLWSGAIEGLFAVGTTAASYAYLADTTETESRTRIFALYLGLYNVGQGLGPFMCSTITHLTGNSLNVYWLSIPVHILFLLICWLILPESLLPIQMEVAQRKHQEEIAARRPKEKWLSLSLLLSPLAPLGVFLPKSAPDNSSRNTRRKDWSLALIALAYLPDTLISGAGVYYFQYGISFFGWASEMIGLVLSLNYISKAAFLSVLLPLAIKFLKPDPHRELPSPTRIRPPSPNPDASTPLLGRSTSISQSQACTSNERNGGLLWDLALAKLSLVVQIGALFLMSVATTSWAFVGGILSVSFGAGYTPTINALALEFYRRSGGTEAGKLFGAMTFVQVLGYQILGPAIFGFLFMTTVETHPKTILYAGMVIVFSCFIFLQFVRIPPDISTEPTLNETAEELH
ncbi:major facilitator superfamily domain-containing protein [Amylostereum chailletii]|nr:major facilitator superfamily domain-containing protein [Amylostereum chailletii]